MVGIIGCELFSLADWWRTLIKLWCFLLNNPVRNDRNAHRIKMTKNTMASLSTKNITGVIYLNSKLLDIKRGLLDFLERWQKYFRIKNTVVIDTRKRNHSKWDIIWSVISIVHKYVLVDAYSCLTAKHFNIDHPKSRSYSLYDETEWFCHFYRVINRMAQV